MNIKPFLIKLNTFLNKDRVNWNLAHFYEFLSMLHYLLVLPLAADGHKLLGFLMFCIGFAWLRVAAHMRAKIMVKWAVAKSFEEFIANKDKFIT